MFSPEKILGSGKKTVLLMKMNTDRLRGGELEAVLRHPLLNAVYTQLHTSLHSVKRLSTHTQSKVIHKQGAISTFKTALTMLLILMLKRAGDKMLPCGTPISLSLIHI